MISDEELKALILVVGRIVSYIEDTNQYRVFPLDAPDIQVFNNLYGRIDEEETNDSD